jgi:hypothetical protein
MSVNEIMSMFVNKRKARAEKLRDELIELHQNVSDIEDAYGSDITSYPEPISIEYNSYVKRALEIRDAMIELRKEKELDMLYENIAHEIEELIQ